MGMIDGGEEHGPDAVATGKDRFHQAPLPICLLLGHEPVELQVIGAMKEDILLLDDIAKEFMFGVRAWIECLCVI